VLRETDPQITLWDALLSEVVRRLPAEMPAVDAHLDNERFSVLKKSVDDEACN
jgi:hypothetical protein